MTVSIIICSRNRAESLKPTLISISRVTIPQGWQVELLVVNNGSTDHTQVILDQMEIQNVAFRHIIEPHIGKCYACNTAIRESSGNTILFTDDDVLVPPDWIENMCQPIVDGRADAVQGGIKLAPHLERPWLTGALRVWLASVEDPKSPPEGLVGANMAFSREAFEAAGGFDTRLGPGAAGFYDDTLFGWALKRQGKRILYLPMVSVEHHFAPERLTFRAYVGTAERMATSRAVVLGILEPNRPRPSIRDLLVQIPRFAARSLTQAIGFMINGAPDPGFIVRYYRILLWRKLYWKPPAKPDSCNRS